ncbi:hypothetical protein FAES_4437 [Fibrella aestuarina BUZ 2]|uniref:DUF5872 domain-containing protein n=1 Tax=Fibrella aestuarina BUZ 2 TaxID=1166018 RepID=I0KE83_9BACT|nr:hypothetical protein [Fibrella aestuarina]CCH02436.1 hypothetical protein FAES_4437 [Fibrella aestuarina BUZ 2]
MATTTTRKADSKTAKRKADDGKATQRTKLSATKKPAATKSTKKADNYTDPELREKLKADIKEGDKGGKAGQWSARKAQLLAHEYEKAGGGYKDDHKTESQQHLDKWTDEDWQTADGKPAEREGGTTRYLPKEAWDKLSPAEKKATNAKKVAGSKAGKQNVPNTEKAKKARASKKD